MNKKCKNCAHYISEPDKQDDVTERYCTETSERVNPNWTCPLWTKDISKKETKMEISKEVPIVPFIDISALPIVDNYEIVRCKDCKWWHDVGCAIRIVDESDEPKDDDYCSFGERREDETS